MDTTLQQASTVWDLTPYIWGEKQPLLSPRSPGQITQGARNSELLGQQFLSGGDFAPQGLFGNIGRHFRLSRGTGVLPACIITGMDVVKHPTTQDRPHNKDLSSPKCQRRWGWETLLYMEQNEGSERIETECHFPPKIWRGSLPSPTQTHQTMFQKKRKASQTQTYLTHESNWHLGVPSQSNLSCSLSPAVPFRWRAVTSYTAFCPIPGV